MTRAEELAEIYSRAMNGKPVDVFVYNESGALESKVVGYVWKENIPTMEEMYMTWKICEKAKEDEKNWHGNPWNY